MAEPGAGDPGGLREASNTTQNPGQSQAGPRGPPTNNPPPTGPPASGCESGTGGGSPGTYGPFNRQESQSQSPEVALLQQISGQLWGRIPRWGLDQPVVQAYRGPLPEGQRGIEFYTNVPPEPQAHSLPNSADWRGPRDGVTTWTDQNGTDWARIDINMTKNTQTRESSGCE